MIQYLMQALGHDDLVSHVGTLTVKKVNNGSCSPDQRDVGYNIDIWEELLQFDVVNHILG